MIRQHACLQTIKQLFIFQKTYWPWIYQQPHLTFQVSTYVFQPTLSEIKIQQSRDDSYNATLQEFQNLQSKKKKLTAHLLLQDFESRVNL